MDLYLFDFDKTLYAYDFRGRLPALARLSGVSEYRLASAWWADGYEHRAEAGEWPTAAEYLAKLADVTEAPVTLSLEQWAEARLTSMTRIETSVASLERASHLGTVSLLSNNPSPFAEALPLLAPDVCAIVGENRLLSCALGVRKPDPRIFQLAVERYGADPANTFFADDSLDNVAGARSLGIHAHHFTGARALDDAITEFAERQR